MTLALTKQPEHLSHAPPTLANQLVGALRRADIDTYFGVPGGAIEPLFNALARHEARGEVRVVATRSESGAAFAADGYYRATSRLAVCTGTTGPGISNLLTAVINAHADRIPMLVITPQVSLPKHGRGALQESGDDGYDLARMLAACTVFSSTVTHPEQLPHKLMHALARAQMAPSGPVHLSVPADVFMGKALQEFPERASKPAAHGVARDTAGLREMLHALETARRPVFYVGDDAGPRAAELNALAGHLNALVVSSPQGKRWISHVDNHYRGVVGFSGHRAALDTLLAADLVVAFGVTFDELSTNAWTALPKAPTFVVDRHATFSHRLPHGRWVIGDVGEAVTWMAGRTATRALPQPSSIQRRAHLEGWLGAPDAAVHPRNLMAWLSAELPDDVVAHFDSGNSFSWSTRHLVRSKPDTYRVAMGLCSMAWAVSAVLGDAVGRGKRTFCVTGDGAMLMSALELSTAVQLQLPVTYVVLNDRGFGMVRHGQRLAGAPSIAHEIAPVRFDGLARAVGASAFRVRSRRELADVPRWFLSSDSGGPCLIDVEIDREAVPPMAERVMGLASGVPK